MKGLISNTLDWLTAPSDNNTSIELWVAGLVVIMVLSFGWATLINSRIVGE